MKNCIYCPDPATSIYNEELLCSRHYRVLYLKKDKKRATRTVYKTRDEAKLKVRYMELLSRPHTQEEFAALVESFKEDAKVIAMENPLYKDLIN